MFSSLVTMVLLLLPVTLLSIIINDSFVLSTRVRLHPDSEPKSKEVYNNNRMVAYDLGLYYLQSAGLLNDSNIDSHFLEDKRGLDGKFLRGDFRFRALEKMRKYNTLRWFATLEEVVARQVYDDSREQDLSAGPQVNQEMCGLHLNYMLHLIEHHNKRLVDSNELSIFSIMNTYEPPHMGLADGSNFFLGGYESCVTNKLNVMRKELERVNKTAARKYFEMKAQVKPSNWSSSFMKRIFRYIGPFFGFPYVEKVSFDAVRDKIHLLPMRYCMIGLRWPAWPNSTFHRRSLNVRAGICLPESCDSKSLTLFGDKIKRLYNSQLPDYYAEYYIQNLYCLPDERSSFRNPFNYSSTVAFIVFNVIWLTLTAVAVLKRHSNGRAISEKTSASLDLHRRACVYLSAWSASKNWLSFVALKRNSENGDEKKRIPQIVHKIHEVDLTPLEGLKVAASLSVMISHGSMMYYGNSINNDKAHQMLSNSWSTSGFIAYPAIVDIFFVISSVMTAKIMLEMSNKVLFKPLFWVKFIVYRYIRLVPLYLLLHWFLKSTFRFIGSGPMWDYGTSHTSWSKMCQDESWWRVILPSANFISPSTHCNGVGWYLANDIQFSLLTPIVIVLLRKRPHFAHIMIIGALFAAIAAHITYYYRLDLDWRGTFEWNAISLSLVTDDASTGYVYPQYRCVSYLIGMLAGYQLDKYAKGKIESWPKKFITYGKLYVYLLIYGLLFLPFIASLLPLNNSAFMRAAFSLYSGTIHSIASTGAAIFILLLCTGHFPTCKKVFSIDGLRILAKASLSTVLVHLPLMFYRSQSQTRLRELGTYDFYKTMVVWVVESFFISIIVHVVYEIPTRAILVKLLTRLPSPANAKDQKSEHKEKIN